MLINAHSTEAYNDQVQTSVIDSLHSAILVNSETFSRGNRSLHPPSISPISRPLMSYPNRRSANMEVGKFTG